MNFKIQRKAKDRFFLLSTWWTDSQKSKFDSMGNSLEFQTSGIDIREIKKNLLDEMEAEASAP
jgi:hypothetical protein